MAGRWRRGPRRSVVVLACLLGGGGLLTGSSAGEEVTRRPLRLFQLNLCDSGLASCYTGQSVAQAAAAIRTERPDVVTLNEVCEDDVDALKRTLAGVDRRGAVVAAFKAADDRRTGAATRCRNGQRYGIGLLARVAPPYRGHAVHGGLYPMQDAGDPEERAWLCIHADSGFYACTTHLASASSAVALAQCRYLLRTAIPRLRRPGGYGPMVLAGDLNLRNRGPRDVRSCVPSGYLRRDDGGVQQVVTTADVTVGVSRVVDLAGTTDHPGLLVALKIAGR